MLQRFRTPLLASIVLALLASGCGDDCPGPEGDYYGFVATVTRTDFLGPVCDARVTYTGGDFAGEREAEIIGCEYYGPLNEVGNFHVTVYKPNYKQQTEWVDSYFGGGGREPEDEGCGLYQSRPAFELVPVVQ